MADLDFDELDRKIMSKSSKSKEDKLSVTEDSIVEVPEETVLASTEGVPISVKVNKTVGQIDSAISNEARGFIGNEMAPAVEERSSFRSNDELPRRSERVYVSPREEEVDRLDVDSSAVGQVDDNVPLEEVVYEESVVQPEEPVVSEEVADAMHDVEEAVAGDEMTELGLNDLPSEGAHPLEQELIGEKNSYDTSEPAVKKDVVSSTESGLEVPEPTVADIEESSQPDVEIADEAIANSNEEHHIVTDVQKNRSLWDVLYYAIVALLVLVILALLAVLLDNFDVISLPSSLPFVD